MCAFIVALSGCHNSASPRCRNHFSNQSLAASGREWFGVARPHSAERTDPIRSRPLADEEEREVLRARVRDITQEEGKVQQVAC